MFGAEKGVFLKVDNEGFFPECARIIAEDRHVFVMNVNSEEFGVNSILKLIKLS